MLKEGIAAIEAAEQVNNGCKALVDSIILEALEPNSEFFVKILCNVGRSELLLVHELSKAVVASLLEANLVDERIADELVNLSFKS